MAIDLNPITSGYNLSKINENFQKTEDYINDKLLARADTGVAGEGKMERDLDMDGYTILNADLDGSSITNDRAIRVPTAEGPIPPLPDANTRKGTVLGFSPIDGLPTVLIPSSGSAADVLMQLAASNGLRNIGQCPNIATLRTIEPSSSGELIFLKEHTASTGLGGGVFRGYLVSALTDNNGTVIKTTANNVWIRQNADVVNPIMFGAKGDGTTNDLVPINAAISNSTEMDGLGLTYSISGGAITVDGAASKSVYNFKIVEPAVNNTTMLRINTSNKIVRNIIFDGTTGLTSRGIIVASGVSDVLITRNSFLNLKKYAVGVSGDYTNNIFCSRIKVDDNYAINCGNDATNFDRNTILFDGANTCSVTRNTFLLCNWGIAFRQPYTYPALTEPYSFYNKVTHNYMSGKVGYPYNQCVSAQSQKHLEVHGNTIEGFLGNGVDNQRCDFSRVTNNRINSGDDGIFFGDLVCRGHVATNNVITGCVRGIRVYGNAAALPSDFMNQNMTDIVISNNSIHDCTSYGIYIYRTETTDTFTGYVVSNNVVDNTGTRSLANNFQGILLTGLNNSSIVGNVVRNTRLEGIRIVNGIALVVADNNVSGFDFSNTAQAGIYIDVTSRGVQLRNSTITSSGGTGAAVRETGINNTVTGTRWNAVTTGVNATGTGVVLADNVIF